MHAHIHQDIYISYDFRHHYGDSRYYRGYYYWGIEIMKQIILKNKVLKIENCDECPMSTDPCYYDCYFGLKLNHENLVSDPPNDCPLEDFIDTIRL